MMDEFKLYLSPLGVLALLTNRGRKYEILFRDCTSADKVFSFLHIALHDHRPNGAAKHFYSRDDDATAFRWIKKLNDNAWCDPIALGSIVKGVQDALSLRPVGRQVVEHEWVSLKLA
jgi:hypothetical protein